MKLQKPLQDDFKTVLLSKRKKYPLLQTLAGNSLLFEQVPYMNINIFYN